MHFLLKLHIPPFSENNPRHLMIHTGFLKAFKKAEIEGKIILTSFEEADFIFSVHANVSVPKEKKFIYYDVESLYEQNLKVRADAIFTTEENAIQPFIDQFSCPVFHLPLGFDPEVYKAQYLPYTSDIIFCGTLLDPRPEVLSWLDPVSNKYKIRIITPTSWRSRLRNKGNIEVISSEEWMSPEKMILEHLRSKIILCINRAEVNKNTQLKNRTPGRSFGEAALNRCIFIDSSRDISKFFTPGEEIITFELDRYGSDLRARLDFYLGEFEDLREEIAQAGHIRALKEHTWDHRSEILINTLHNLNQHSS